MTVERRRLRESRKYTAYRSALSMLKLEAGCVDCGYSADPAALDFDHVRGEKSFNIGAGRQGMVALLNEVEKCVVRCANCHRIRTAEARYV